MKNDLIWGIQEWVRDCWRALLELDSTTNCYRYQAGKCNMVVPAAKFEEAVQTYMQQYRCSEQRARETALKLEMWDVDKSGLFYRI